MGQKFANNAKTRLASNVGTDTTSFTVVTGEGDLFPTLTPNVDHFLVTFEDSSGNKEIARVVSRSGDTFGLGRIVNGSISQAPGEGRGLDGTSSRAFNIGDLVEIRLVAGFIDALKRGTVPFVIDGGGSPITAGIKGFIEVSFGGTIEQVRAFADDIGTLTVNIYKQSYDDYPFVSPDDDTDEVTDSTGGDEIRLNSAEKFEKTSFSSSWKLTFSPGDIFVFEVTDLAGGGLDPAFITKCTISLTVDRSYDPTL
jgi:hypothetical protein